MMIQVTKYREDTKKWACYKGKSAEGIEVQLFVPVNLPEAQNEAVEVEVK